MNVLKKFYVLLLLVSFLAIVASALLYIVHFYRPFFTSDEAVMNMLAGAMAEQGRLFPKGWIYNNGDLMVPSGALIIAPLLRWMPNGFAVHSVAAVFAVFLLLSSLIWLLRTLRMPLDAILIVSMLVASGFSFYAVMFVLAQTSYVWWPAGFLLGATLIYRYRAYQGSKRAHALIPLLLFLLVFSLSVSNPGRVLLMMVLPLYVFDLALGRERSIPAERRVLHWTRMLGLRDALVIFSLGGGFLLATVLYVVLQYTGTIQTIYGAASLRWGGWDSVPRHAEMFARGWFNYVGGVGEARDGTAISMILTGFRYVVIASLTVIGMREVWAIPHQCDRARRALAAAFIAAFVPILAMYLLFESLAFLNQWPTVRYFTVPIYILVALAAFALRDLVTAWPRCALILLSITAICFVAVASYRFLPVYARSTADFWKTGNSRTMRLGELLQEHGLRWGYATYWTAGATTVMSDSAVHVYAVTIDGRGIAPYSFMALHDWYRPQRWGGKTFLALAPNDADEAQSQLLEQKLGPPESVIESPDYRVAIYDRNIAEDISCFQSAPLNERIGAGVKSAILVNAAVVTDEHSPQARLASVRVRNEGAFPVNGVGRFPLAIGVRLLDENGSLVNRDWIHSLLPCPLKPGGETTLTFALPQLPPGSWHLKFDLVQEGVAWFEDRGFLSIDVPLRVSSLPPSRATGSVESDDVVHVR